VAEDVAGIVEETDGGAGRSGASDVSEASEARRQSAPETGSGTPQQVEAAEAAETGKGVETGKTAETGEAAEATESSEAAETGQAAATGVVTADGESTEAPRRRRRIWIVLICAALALAVDTVSKAVVVANLQDRGPIHVPGGFLNLTLIRNSGAAFSIGEGQTWVFTVIAAAVVFVILRVSRNLRSLPWAIALGLLLGGALGNLSDRLLRSPGVGRGDVVDFLQFPTFPLVHYDFPVFNLADTSIVIGGCLMVLLSFLGMQPDGTRHKDLKPADGTAEEPSAEDQ
jgi:signal peptidase II